MNKKNNRKGFTIVELVIVIAVIGILATVLIPTFGNVMEKAKNSELVQQLRNEYMDYIASEAVKDGYDPDATVIIKIGDNYYSFVKGEMQMSSTDATVPAEYEIDDGEFYWDDTAMVKYEESTPAQT